MTRVISDKWFIKLNLTTFLSSQLPGFNLQGRVWLNSPLASEWSTPVVPVYIKTSAFTEKNQSELCISTNESAPICPCIALPRWLEEGCCSILLSPVQEIFQFIHRKIFEWINLTSIPSSQDLIQGVQSLQADQPPSTAFANVKVFVY